MLYVTQYQPTYVTADAVILKHDKDELEVLAITRANDPYKGYLALPGGFVEPYETASQAATRELNEETGIKFYFNENYLVGAYSNPNRDPRGRIISLAYYGLLDWYDNDKYQLNPSDDASDAEWIDVEKFSKVAAFDHAEIVNDAIDKLDHVRS
jgi:8-oxo-dGTP diphosphatase